MHVNGTLPVQHEIASSVASSIARTPSAPACLSRLAADLDRGIFAVAGTSVGRGALDELREGLFSAPGREREALALWHESLATAAYAELLCGVSGASIGVASLGGLLHRVGDAWMLRNLARSEARSGARLDAPSRSRLSSLETAACAARLVRDWKLSAPVAACVTDWRRCGELEPVAPEATAVYCGRLLALELLRPQFCAPAATASAVAEHGFDGDAFARIRGSDLRVLRLVRSVD
ncbi:MAG: HDOD domain-containing protein [Gammaproteobacteria bacterium]